MAKERVEPIAEVVPSAGAPDRFPVSLIEFARTYHPRQDVELMGAFVSHARSQQWTSARPDEWAARFEKFRNSPA